MNHKHALPVLVYDDDCGFCTWCAAWVVRHGSLDAVGFANLTADDRSRLPDDYEACAHLITTDSVYSCGAAAEWAIARTYPELQPLFCAFRLLPGYSSVRERLYRFLANRRSWLGKILSAESPVGERDQL
ncbi:thiol-disulfide oxidoreductase DCC family protein [Halocatena marina]|uniref:Thiol-disulfide oxidoreductase DCC family protein n=2 Tax=Halocatena marina TaxID=2934937 RepID=A0ABD5YPC1_9EURY|nr:DUF393 domain-containing protein [Halocatena marina]